MRKLVEERTGANSQNQFYKLNPKVDDIPDTYGKTCNGVKLLVLGTVETGGGGCVCPEHVMLKPPDAEKQRCSNHGYGGRSGASGPGHHGEHG